ILTAAASLSPPSWATCTVPETAWCVARKLESHDSRVSCVTLENIAQPADTHSVRGTISEVRYLILLLACAALAQPPDARLKRLADAILIDTHVDTPWYVVDEGYDMGEEHKYYEADIPRLKRGRVVGVVFGSAVAPQKFP